ncbi:MAG: 2,5-dihydroxypyridine 5,6-dioxygenase [Rhodospirillaceae bacterium]|jgi:2,5-dihydroxypyridine 5,6-dioxygenase|nr:2,5-dihydroxypyridine 5,6-dioxygenase [Rhodospirillaceae bacterium]
MLAKPGEHVLVTADTASDPAVVRAIWDAARELTDKVAVLISPRMPFQGGFADPYISDPLRSSMMNADVWIELAFPYIAGSHAFDAAMKNNRTRYYLSTGLTSDAMLRLFASADVNEVFALQRRFDEYLVANNGKECRITNPLGTDVTFTLETSHLPFGMCRAETPGLTGVLGTVFVMPNLDSVKGTIKVENICSDDVYIPLPEPVALQVDGKVRSISGGGAKREFVESALRKGGGGKDYGYVVHFTCGIHPGARYTGKCFVEDQRVPGYNAVGLGLPFWVDGGGETHPDTVLSSQSIWIEGQQIVKDGVIVGPAGLAEQARKIRLVA